MPGFVDVSNMSDLEIKRLGQCDDFDEQDPPRRGRYSRRAQPGTVKSYPADDVWAAACTAYRLNGNAYLKDSEYEVDATGAQRLVRHRNRDVMAQVLARPHQITDQDRAQARECRQFLQNDITFRTLKNTLTEFDRSVTRCLAVSDRFDGIAHRYEMAVIACLPHTQRKQLVRYDQQERLQACGQLDAPVGTKVQLQVEVIRSNYSQNYGVHFITAVTRDQQAVFFSYREAQAAGAWLTIKGTVKAQRDRQTQLNRVKVL